MLSLLVGCNIYLIDSLLYFLFFALQNLFETIMSFSLSGRLERSYFICVASRFCILAQTNNYGVPSLHTFASKLEYVF